MNDSQSCGGLVMNKGWLYVGLTCFFEFFWILGFNIVSTWWHWIIIGIFILIDFYFLTKACEKLPTGTVYAVFAGIGSVGTAFMDYFLFGGSLGMGKMFFIVLLLIGVVSLHIADKIEEEKALEGIV